MWKVYILFSELFRKTYVGCSSDSQARLKKHNEGHVISTKKYRPWKIVYEESLENYNAARKRETYFKNASGRRKIKTIFKNLGLNN